MVHPRSVAGERVSVDGFKTACLNEVEAEPEVTPEIHISARAGRHSEHCGDGDRQGEGA